MKFLIISFFCLLTAAAFAIDGATGNSVAVEHESHTYLTLEGDTAKVIFEKMDVEERKILWKWIVKEGKNITCVYSIIPKLHVCSMHIYPDGSIENVIP